MPLPSTRPRRFVPGCRLPAPAGGAAVAIIVAPYDSGRREWRMGAGPRVLARVVRERLVRRGIRVHEVDVAPGGAELEIAASFRLYARIAAEAARARAAGRFPLVVGGNCGCALGATLNEHGDPASILWFDAHADFNTPDTTTSGFLDGMALAALTGRCWTALASLIPAFVPLRPTDVLLAGARDVDAAERTQLADAGVARLDAAPAEVVHAAIVAWLASRTTRGALHVHLDADAFDRSAVGAANAYACDGGFTTEAMLAAADTIAANARLTGLSVASYDPTCDPAGSVREAVAAFVERLLIERPV